MADGCLGDAVRLQPQETSVQSGRVKLRGQLDVDRGRLLQSRGFLGPLHGRHRERVESVKPGPEQLA